VPEPVERHLADDGDGGAVEQLGDVRPHEGGAHDDGPIGVHDELGPAAGVVGGERSARHRGEVVLGRPHFDPALAGGRLGQPETGDLRVGEDDLRHGSGVGARGEAAPRRRVVRLPLRARDDDLPTRPGLVLALVGEQHPAGDVTCPPPVDTARAAGGHSRRSC
jgi:hypothetical protein